MSGASEPEIRPFRIDVAQSDLDDLTDRLERTRFAPDIPDADCGVPVGRVKDLVEHWRVAYDWRQWEAALNARPQFMTHIDGLDVHFLHVPSPAPEAFPLILTHGWPMSVVEYLDVIDPLTNPASDAGDAALPFDVVIPSIPGFAFSESVRERGCDHQRVAAAWAELMRRLGYERYGAHGNDIGGMISLELGRVDSEHVAGVHVTQAFSLPSADRREVNGLDDGDLRRLQESERFIRDKGAYLQLQSTQPQTLAHALADSPVGQLAWSLQLFGDDVSNDYILSNVMIYWLTNTAGSSALTAYFEPGRAHRSTGQTTVPLGVAAFADDVFQSVRPLAERDHANIVSWNTYGRGGHHPAHVAPDVLVDDIRGFFSLLRRDHSPHI